jgi:hypothetical protein
MGSIKIEMRHKRNPNPNPKDAGVLPRLYGRICRHSEKGPGPPRVRRRLLGHRRVGSGHHLRAYLRVNVTRRQAG